MKLLIIFLSFICIGCGTTKHTIICTSNPSGTKVTINEQECEAPCKIKVPWGSDATTAKYSLPDGRTKIIKLPKLPGRSAEISQFGSYACYIIAAPLIGGPLAVLVLVGAFDSDKSRRAWDKHEWGLIGVAAVGGIFLYSGKILEIKPTSVNAKFDTIPNEKENKRVYILETPEPLKRNREPFKDALTQERKLKLK